MKYMLIVGLSLILSGCGVSVGFQAGRYASCTYVAGGVAYIDECPIGVTAGSRIYK